MTWKPGDGACWNPQHLRLGTISENNKDTAAKRLKRRLAAYQEAQHD